MAARDRGLLPVPDGLDAQMRDFLTGVRRLLLDVQAGRLATATAATPTAAPTPGEAGTPGPPGPSGPPGPVGPAAPSVEPDLTPPPTPDNLAAVGAFSHVLVSWDVAVYTQGRGNKHTLLYAKKWPTGSPAPTFSEDALQATVPHPSTVYPLPSDPNTRWAIWAKFETNDGEPSVSPAGGANGVVATTGQDVSSLLAVLAGQITESQLFAALGARIDLIDGGGPGSVNARLAAETSARVAAISAEASARAADILAEANTRISSDASLQASINAVSAATTANLNTALAAVADEAAARSSGDSAEALARTTLATQLRGNYTGGDPSLLTSGLIYNERVTRVAAESALSSSITALQSTVRRGFGASLLPSTFESLANWTNSRGGTPEAVDTAAGTLIANDADFGQCVEITSFAAAGGNILHKGVVPALAGKVYRITARFKVVAVTDGSAQFNIVIAGLDTTYGNSGTTFPTSTTVSPSGVVTITQLTAANASTGIVAWPAGAKYLRCGLRLNSTETGLTLRVQSITIEDATDATTLNAAITSEQTTRANADAALASDLTALTSTVTTNNSTLTAALATEQTTRASADSAFSASLSTLTATVDANTAAIATETSVRASQTAGLLAQYTVKVDVNGYVAGFGLASTANNGTPTSEFIVRADKFAIANPAGPGITPAVPFVVRTTPTTENGVSIPAGVYIDAAYLVNLQARYATIANLVADDIQAADISVGQLTAGTLAVGAWMQSTNYVANTAGWKISGDGSAEFGFANIRGLLLASQIGANSIAAEKIDTRGLDIKDAGGNVVFGANTRLAAAYIDAVASGGNLAFNSSFELDSDGNGTPDGYASSFGTGIDISNSLSTVRTHGAVALVLTVNGITTPTGSAQHLIVTQESAQIRVLPDIPYYVAIDARTSNTAYKARLGVAWYDSGGTLLDVEYVPDLTFASASVYRRFGGRVIAPAGAVFARPRFGILRASVNDTTVSSMRFDALHFGPGDLPGNYSPGTRDLIGLDNMLTAANVSTFIAAAAIGDAYIANLNADKINAGSIRGRNVQAAAFMTKGTFLTAAPAAGAATVQVDNTDDFPASGSAWIIDTTNDRDLFTYTGKTATSFTGCSGVLGSHTVGASVVPRSKGMLIDRLTNEQRFFGDRGTGTVDELVSIGLNDIGGGDLALVKIGSSSSTHIAIDATGNGTAPLIQVLAAGSAQNAISSISQGSGAAINAFADGSGSALLGFAGNGTGYAANLTANLTRGHIRMVPLAGRPSVRTNGQVAMIFTTGGSTDARTGTPRPMYADGTDWRLFSDNSIWGG